MSQEPIIKVENISKSYVISHRAAYDTIRDKLTEFVKKPYELLTKKKTKDTKETFWALKDINFNINKGERIGIIGKNGAGKSTLLKILSQITHPTAGKIELNGRVASLLEVGTGFHPELTGRENIFLNGAILGMKRSEIISKFDEIVKFSEIGNFLDTPVKRYSSGMFVRLAFSVAAHLEPEILIVDEVLAVGDVEFQKKCLGKMESVAEEGRTIIFVSHNMNAITSLCDRCIVIEKGIIKMDSDVKSAIYYYLNNSVSNIYKKSATNSKNPEIIKAWFENANGETTDQFFNGEKIILNINTSNKSHVPFEISIAFFDHIGRPLWNFSHIMHNLKTLPGEERLNSKITFNPPKVTVPKLIVDLAVGPKGGFPFFDHIQGALKCSIIDKNDGANYIRYPEWPILCEAKLVYQTIK